MNGQGAMSSVPGIPGLEPGPIWALVDEGLRRTNLYVFIFDRGKRFLYVSPSAARELGRPPGSFQGRTGREIDLEGDVAAAFEALVDLVIASEATLHGERTVQRNGSPHIYEYDAFRLFGGGDDASAIMVFLTDRTRERRQQAFIEGLNRINQEIGRLQDPESIMSRVADIAGDSMGGDPMGIVLREGGAWTARYIYALPAEDVGYRFRWIGGLLDRSLHTGEPLVMDDVRDFPEMNNEDVERREIRSLASFPFRVFGRLEGALLFFRPKAVRPYEALEIDFGRRLAASVAVALGNSMMYLEVKRSEEEKAVLLEQIGSEKELLHAMMEGAGTPMALIDAASDPRLVACNAAYRAAVSTPAGVASPEGRLMRDLLPADEFEAGLKMHQEVMRARRPCTVEHQRTGPQGAKEHFLVSMVPLCGKMGPRALLTATNITQAVKDKVRIEDLAIKADEERKRLRAIINNLPVGVIIVDAEGKVIESNEVRDRIWGGPTNIRRIPNDLKNLRGRWADTGIKLAEEDWPLYRSFKYNEKVLGAAVDVLRQDGSRGTVLNSSSPIRNEAGQRIGAMGVSLDITAQRRMEHEAVEAKERAELYLDLLTHDISNLNIVTSSTIQLAMAKEDAQKLRDGLERALESLGESNMLIDNVRKLQMIESRELSRTLVDLGWVLEDIVEDQKGPAGSVRINYRPQLRRFVLATDLIKDVFTNIIGNAVRHSGGSVTIDIALSKAFEGGQEMYKVVVEDDGPGIPDADKSKVFLRKFRGSRTGGTGLGLYLVKRLVEDCGGRVWVEDRVSGDHAKGSRFVVMLPAVASPNKGSIIDPI